MIFPVDLPSDPLGWRWHLALAVTSVPFLVILGPSFFKKEVTRKGQVVTGMVMVVWAMFVVALRFFMGWLYGV
jgi:hypothetical protein